MYSAAYATQGWILWQQSKSSTKHQYRGQGNQYQAAHILDLDPLLEPKAGDQHHKEDFHLPERFHIRHGRERHGTEPTY